MTINKIEHNLQGNPRNATIPLDVEEIMYISNALYQAVKSTENPSPAMLETKRDIYLLFELVKNGCIDSFVVEYLNKCQEKIKEVEEK